MAHAAATATPADWPWHLWLISIGVVLLWAAGYAIACWLWPFTRCGRCKGTGRRPSPTGKAWGPCRKCKGKAARIRTGRKTFNWLKITSEEA